MKRNAIILLFLVFALVFAAKIRVPVKERGTGEMPAPKAKPLLTSAMEKPTTAPAISAALPVEMSTVPSEEKAKPVPEKAAVQATINPPTVAPVKKPGAKKVVQDPMAREALSFVGLDLNAEMYWFDAIHDPTLPASERQDLIDDLNEQGLADPKHPTLDDLPLILSRLEILEALVPTITDGLDWKESHDDLVNLAALALGDGKPVQ